MDMTTESLEPTATPPVAADHPAAVESVVASPGGRRHPKRAAAAVAGSLLVAGGAIAALLGPISVNAASPSPSPSSAASAPAASQGTTGSSGTIAAVPSGGSGTHVSDTSVAAKAIGISEADLLTALQSGKTIADVAKANNVDPQKVIDALVQDDLAEHAAAVTAGTLTQAQAATQLANLTQHATDQVDSTPPAGPGPGGPGAVPSGGSGTSGSTTGG